MTLPTQSDARWEPPVPPMLLAREWPALREIVVVSGPLLATREALERGGE